MEVCTKLPVSDCGSGDWYVDPPTNLIKASAVIDQTFNISTHKAGTTAVFAAPESARYARRVAFKRNASDQLEEQGNNKYKPLGIDADGKIKEFPYASEDLPRPKQNALWFRTSNDASVANLGQVSYDFNKRLYYYLPIDADGDGNPDLTGQPLLVPVLQIHDANNTSSIRSDGSTQDQFRDKWIQQPSADTTIYNATFVLGNSPSRSAETSAGFQNFVRFSENWNNKTAKISGSFIQLKRSSFATGPISPIFAAKSTTDATNTANDTTANLSLFDYALDTYPTPNGSGLLPFYNAPTNRSWGFDVGLLSEQPDLFAQRFTLPPAGRPNEYFREVGRDDTWVKTLLCAGEASNQTGIPTTGVTVTYANAVSNEYRQGCPSASIPSDLPPS